MRRISVLAVVISVLAAFAVACSGDSQQAAPEPQVQSQPTEEAPQQDDSSALDGRQDQAETQESVEAESQQDDGPAVSADGQEQEAAQSEPQTAETDNQQQAPQVTEEADEQEEAPQNKFVLGGDRPATLVLPVDADVAAPRPLILLLHGYSSHAAQADQYFQFSQWVDRGGFGLLIPNGTIDQISNRFWNATPECCDIFGAEPDDVGYLKALIEEAREIAAFDLVFAVGHSNGGFMAYRLACEAVPGLTGIVNLAGGAYSDPADCRVPAPLSVLHIHGTEDEEVLYLGGRLPNHPDPDRAAVPGAEDSVRRWAHRAGCDLDTENRSPWIDTDSSVEGDETWIHHFVQGCAAGTAMTRWTILGGGHVPLVWGTDFTPRILSWIDSRYRRETGLAPKVLEQIVGGERSARLQLPSNRTYEAIQLVLSLHGYAGETEAHDWYFGLSDRILKYGFALITPQGTTDSRGNAFWNATDACCNFDGSDVDDSAWLSALVAEAQEIVDVSGVHVVGYSNGGFMAYRLACDGLEDLVSIVSLAGSSFGDAERCEGAEPISVLQIHGTDDLDIPIAGTLEYEGGYPGAVELINRWAERAGCDVESAREPGRFDLEETIDGAETSVWRIHDGCADGITIELWTIEGADHFPSFQDDWPDRLLRWLFSDSRAN